jgi:hypothetical protein
MINLVVAPYVPRKNYYCESPPIDLTKDLDIEIYIISVVVMIITTTFIIWYLRKQQEYEIYMILVALLYFTFFPFVNTFCAVIFPTLIIIYSIYNLIENTINSIKDKKERRRLKKIDDEMNEFENLIEKNYNESRRF